MKRWTSNGPRRPRSLRNSLLTMAAISLTISHQAKAQESGQLTLFRYVGGSPSQAAEWQTVDQGEERLIYRVELEPEIFRARADATQIHVPLPEGDFDAQAVRMTGANRASGDFTWHGHFENPDGSEGDVIVTSVAGQTKALVYSSQGTFELARAIEGGYRLRRVERPGHSGCQGGRLAPRIDAPARVREPSTVVPRRGGTVTMDLLVVYANDVSDSSLSLDVASAVDQANVAFQNSQSSARLNLVHIQSVDYNSVDHDADLDWVTADETVAALRDAHHADLVVLIAGPDPIGCGLGWIMEDFEIQSERWAFSVVGEDCLDLTLAHEVGHNLGLAHNPENSDTPAADLVQPWSYGHWVDDLLFGFASVMSYTDPCTFCPWRPYFSNPDVFIGPHPTGIHNQRDSQRTLDEGVGGEGTATLASAFRYGPNDDDRYESNNALIEAHDLSASENTLLSQLLGEGVQRDNDWYAIVILSNAPRLEVDLTFTHADGDIDISLHDSLANEITRSASVTDNESIDILLSPGTYYLKVYYGNAGNTYDMVWRARTTEPDLISSVDGDPFSITPNDFFGLEGTVTNDGNEASTATTLRYYLSSNSFISTFDIEYDSVAVPALTPGQDFSENVIEIAPAPGTWWLGTCVDSIPGEVEVGNQCSQGIRMDVRDLSINPDLAVPEALELPEIMFPFQLFGMTATVENLGQVAAPASTLRYYLSYNQEISPQDAQLTIEAVPSLAGLESIELAAIEVAPQSPGTYWLGVCVDTVDNEFNPFNQCSPGTRIRVVEPETFIFASSFESGDTTDWSSSVP